MKHRTTILLAAAMFAVTIVAVPEVASACAVCFDANEESRESYLGTTIFLSLFPLGMIGGIIFVLWRRARALAEDDQPLPAE